MEYKAQENKRNYEKGKVMYKVIVRFFMVK